MLRYISQSWARSMLHESGTVVANDCKEEEWCAQNLPKNADGTTSYKCVNFDAECPCTCDKYSLA